MDETDKFELDVHISQCQVLELLAALVQRPLGSEKRICQAWLNDRQLTKPHVLRRGLESAIGHNAKMCGA